MDLDSDIDKLKHIFNDFRNVRFPDDSRDEELSDIHAELADYDGYIAGLVSQVIAGTRVGPEKLFFKDGMKSRLQKEINSAGEYERSEVDAYLSYLERLEELLRLAKAVNSQR